jgi:hypothetical protein
MNEKTRELAEQAGAEIWSRAPMRAVTGLAFTDEALEKFVGLIKQDNTQEVIHLCANAIDANLRVEHQKTKNKRDLVELCIIVVAVIAWGTWWYTQLH